MRSENIDKPKRKRLLYLDIIRGMFLVFIILNHVPYAPKLTDLFTGDSALIVTAAEGFFLISGTMVGLLYLSRIRTQTKYVLKKIWSRSLLLYLISIATTLIFTLLGRAFVDVTNGEIYPGSLLSFDFFRHLLSLNYTYGWADFLSLYTIFMLFAPITLFLVAYKRTWAAVLISILIWFVNPIFPDIGNFAAWQILFTIGIIIGGNFQTIVNLFDAKKGIVYIRSIFAIVALACIWSWYVDLIYPYFIAPHVPIPSVFSIINDAIGIDPSLYKLLFDREVMGPLRVVFSTLGFISLVYLFRKYESVINRATGSTLLYLGQNSLLVYVTHSLYIFLTFIIFLTLPAKFGLIERTFIGLAVITITYLTVMLYRKVEHYIKHQATKKSSPERIT